MTFTPCDSALLTSGASSFWSTAASTITLAPLARAVLNCWVWRLMLALALYSRIFSRLSNEWSFCLKYFASLGQRPVNCSGPRNATVPFGCAAGRWTLAETGPANPANANPATASPEIASRNVFFIYSPFAKCMNRLSPTSGRDLPGDRPIPPPFRSFVYLFRPFFGQNALLEVYPGERDHTMNA